MLKNYTQKAIWIRKGENFLIEVVRWEKMTQEVHEEMRRKIGLDDGRFVWNIYCYIYPKHRLFNEILQEEDCPINCFHGGQTLAHWHIKADGTVTAKQYGCDYAHWGDEHFSFMEQPEEATEIFNDAEDLFNILS
jgi:hypothetical protein